VAQAAITAINNNKLAQSDRRSFIVVVDTNGENSKREK